MIMEFDNITFESRREIEAIISALTQFCKDHPNSGDCVVVKKLIDKLEVMHMSW